MRILDKNTDFYDYIQNIYRDDSITFDRTDSYLLTKDIFCNFLNYSRSRYAKRKKYFMLLQVGYTYWLFYIHVTKENDAEIPEDYDIKFLISWKYYDRPRALLKMDIIDFNRNIWNQFYHPIHWRQFEEERLFNKKDILVNEINSGNFKILKNMNKYVYYKDNVFIEKHIPLLKSCGVTKYIDPIDIYLALEEYFGAEKTASERTESIGLTDTEKITNHGFDLKKSFRGKGVSK